MEKHIVVSMLWQIYGKLLTRKQYDVLNDYYNEDLSLKPIILNPYFLENSSDSNNSCILEIW